ncbi:MAG: hypothetical protein KKH93_05605 [Candidatus Omnitrophica bacterium]|nr:hypothetical protein [Candidatus Omnitrophota bacterium]
MSLFQEYFRFDNLSIFVGIFVWFFSILVTVYSMGYMRSEKRTPQYYLYIGLTLIASLGAVFANNLILFMVFWGFLGLLLYLLIGFGKNENTPATAKKAFILIGGTDVLMLLGISLVWKLTGLFEMDLISIPLTSKLAVIAYLCLAAGAFAKAGAMPFHTWVPDAAEDSPAPVTAYLPASLDKLLGIYFLARISLEMFRLDSGMNTFLMFIGSLTIVAAVMMALIQHDFKRLLGYHAVSQVGYMVLGIGTGNPIGIAGGLFHMLNHAIYKSCLFFSAGSVEKQAKTTNLDSLGGLAKYMPVTFVTFLIAAFAISGIPPFNGFVSKWMVYQGILETAKTGGKLWVVWLISAMFGSALTLASFMKLLQAVFLGQPAQGRKLAAKKENREVGILMWLPGVILAFLCLIFGIFALAVPLKHFIFPVILEPIRFFGFWSAGLATILLIISIVIGLLIYFLGRVAKLRQTDPFIGGEDLKNNPQMRISGTEFYNTVQEIGILKIIYRLAAKKIFDIYEVSSKITFGFNRALSYLHNGVLSTYLAWCLLGMGILFYLLLK